MAGQDVGQGDEQTVLVHALEALCHRVVQPDVWVAPMAEVARCLQPVRRSKLSRRATKPELTLLLTVTSELASLPPSTRFRRRSVMVTVKRPERCSAISLVPDAR